VNLKLKTPQQAVDVSAEEVIQLFGLRYSTSLWEALDSWLPWHLWVQKNPEDEDARSRRADLRTGVQFWLGARQIATRGGARTWIHLHAELGRAMRREAKGPLPHPRRGALRSGGERQAS